MFWKKKKYNLKLAGRSGMTYFENDRSIKIFSEMLTGEFDFVIYFNEIEKWENGDIITDSERSQIRLNIMKELRTSKIDWC